MDDCTNRLQRDFQLAVWVASHEGVDLGRIVIPQELWLWSPDGGAAIPAGCYELSELGAKASRYSWPLPVALDIWCRSLGFPARDSWAKLEPVSNALNSQLEKESAFFIRAILIAQSRFSDCFKWIESVTRVVIPLYHEKPSSHDQPTNFRSRTFGNLPGLVQSDIYGGEIQILESLVHESAHNHLEFADAAGPLVDLSVTHLYPSPLRPEPRPLRGILLAYHALAYMCAFYTDAICHAIDETSFCLSELERLRIRLKQAEDVISENAYAFTKGGSAFIEMTREVARYGR